MPAPSLLTQVKHSHKNKSTALV